MTARLDPTEWLWLTGLAALAGFVGLLAGFEPKLAIAFSIAFGFVLLTFSNLAAGLALFAMFSFLELLPGTGAVVSVGKIGGVLLALAWMAVIATRPDAKSDFFAVHPGMTAVVGAFLGWALLSATWAESPGAALGSFGRYLLNALLFLIVFTAVRNRKQAVWVAAALLVGAVAASVYGLAVGGNYGDRLSGGGNDPDGIAAALVVGLAFSAGIAANLKGKPGLRLATAGAAAMCVLGIFFTASRGGLVALAVALVAAMILGGRWRGRIAVGAVIVTTVAVYYFAALASHQTKERITQAPTGSAKMKEGRTTLWKVGERMAKANFVKGVGAGNFRNSSVHYLLEPGAVGRSDQVISKPLVAHNIYLEILSEEGVIGLSLFLMIAGFAIVCSVKAAREFAARGDRGGEMLARSLAVALIGLLAAGTFNSLNYNKELWLLFGFGPAMLAAARNTPRPETDSQPRLAA